MLDEIYSNGKAKKAKKMCVSEVGAVCRGYRPIQGKQTAQYNSHCICGAVYLVFMWCGPPHVAVWSLGKYGVGQKRQNNGREM